MFRHLHIRLLWWITVCWKKMLVYSRWNFIIPKVALGKWLTFRTFNQVSNFRSGALNENCFLKERVQQGLNIVALFQKPPSPIKREVCKNSSISKNWLFCLSVHSPQALHRDRPADHPAMPDSTSSEIQKSTKLVVFCMFRNFLKWV